MFLRVLAATGLIFSVFAPPAMAAEDAAGPRLYNMTQQPAEKPAAEAKPEASATVPVEEKKSAIPTLTPPPVRGMKTITSPRPADDPVAKAKQAEIQRQSKIEYEQRAAKIKAEEAKSGTNRLETMKAAFDAAAKADEAEMNGVTAGDKANPVQTPQNAEVNTGAVATPNPAPTPVAAPAKTAPPEPVFTPPKKDNSGKPPRLFNVQ